MYQERLVGAPTDIDSHTFVFYNQGDRLVIPDGLAEDSAYLFFDDDTGEVDATPEQVHELLS